MARMRSNCLTNGGALTSSVVSSPSNPFALVAKGRSCMAANCSICIQGNQAVVHAMGAADLARTACAAAITSGQVAGGFAGSSPARSRASALSHITDVLELNGMDASRPSGRL